MTVVIAALETPLQRLERWGVAMRSTSPLHALSDYQLTVPVEDSQLLGLRRNNGSRYKLRSYRSAQGQLFASVSSHCEGSLRQHLLPLSHPNARNWLNRCVNTLRVEFGSFARPLAVAFDLDIDLAASFWKEIEDQTAAGFEDLAAMAMTLRLDFEAIHELTEPGTRVEQWTQYLHCPGFTPQALQMILDAQDSSNGDSLGDLPDGWR